jgi:hypothetical protein
VIDDAIAAARHRAAIVLPRMAEAVALAAQVSDGTVLTPDDAVMQLYRERLRLKQAEWVAKHEGERIDAELKVIMGCGSELAGVARAQSGGAAVKRPSCRRPSGKLEFTTCLPSKVRVTGVGRALAPAAPTASTGVPAECVLPPASAAGTATAATGSMRSRVLKYRMASLSRCECSPQTGKR